MPDCAAVEIRPVDAADHQEMVAYQRLYELAERAELPDASVYSIDDTIAVLTRDPVGWLYRGLAAFEDGRMVGEGLLTGATTDSVTTARLWAWVPPGERGRGVGAAVVQRLVEECRSMGRGILQSSVRCRPGSPEPDPYVRFARRHGFAVANVEVERRLALPVAADRLDALATEAARLGEGYALRTVLGPIPADLAPGYCELGNRLRLDAPSGDLVVEAARRTPEVLADQEAELVEQRRTRVTVFALDRDGAVAALTCAVVPADEPHVDQWSTIVAPEHRGHRLGLAVKTAAVGVLQREFPLKRFITTTNAEANTHMIAVNEALGFIPYARVIDLQRILPGFEVA